jgi:hypothetical protein
VISFRTWTAIVRSRSVSFFGRVATQSRASVIDRVATDEMSRPSTVTARTSGYRRLPLQVGHGLVTMYFSSSALM